MSTHETLKIGITIERAKAEAAETLAQLILDESLADKNAMQERIQYLTEEADPTGAEENSKLRENIPALYDKLLESPDTPTMREVHKYDESEKGGDLVVRQIEIDDLGRLDVSYGKENYHSTDAPKYKIEVAGLPRLEIHTGLKYGPLMEFIPYTPPDSKNLFVENMDLLRQQDMLEAICEAAGIQDQQ